MKSRKTLLESLNNRLGNQLEVRRYNLSDIISESYKALYACQSDSNLYRLVESHLADVRKNPKDIDRLSRQLCLVREIARMVESKELKDEDLVAKEKYDTVKPKKERALDLTESKDDEDVEEIEDEDLLEDSNLTEEEVEELTKHLRQIRKDRKTNPTSQTEACNKKKSGTLNEDQINYRVYQLIMDVAFPTDLAASLKGAILSGAEVFTAISGALEEHGLEMAGDDIEINKEVTDVYVNDGYEFFTECDDPKKSVEESIKPRKLKRANESSPVWSRYHIIDPDGETIDSYTDRKDAEEWINQLYKDGDYKKGDLKIVDSRAKNESRSYDNLNLSEFNKRSSSKAFVKTFKKLDSKLHEGTALTRQESIALYKAANSAMTHLSVELEHNPEFLSTFKESVSLLSTDVNKLLGSLKEGKAPSKATMKSLAKFSEALLREDDEVDIEDEEEETLETPETDTDETTESEEMDQEYAIARDEILSDMIEKHGESEDPEVQDKIEQETEDVADLMIDAGLLDSEGNPTGEDPTEVEDSAETPDDVEEKKEEDLDFGTDEDITDDEIAELKKHLKEMRSAKRK